MKFELNQTRRSRDLAQALDGEQGTFTVQQGRQSFLVIAQPGHSIVSMLPLIGDKTWQITKVSNQTIETPQYDAQGQTREQSYRQGRG